VPSVQVALAAGLRLGLLPVASTVPVPSVQVTLAGRAATQAPGRWAQAGTASGTGGLPPPWVIRASAMPVPGPLRLPVAVNSGFFQFKFNLKLNKPMALAVTARVNFKLNRDLTTNDF